MEVEAVSEREIRLGGFKETARVSWRRVAPCCQVALPVDVGGGPCECQMNTQHLQTSCTHKDFLSISGINAKLKERHERGFLTFSAVSAATRLNKIA